MMILTQKLHFLSEGDFYPLNITDPVQSVVNSSGVKKGQVLIYYQHTTGAIAIIEHECGIMVDLEDVLERLAPLKGDYYHHRRGYDQNGAAHVRTAILNVSVILPIDGGRMMLGEYQEIVMIDFDPGLKTRTVIVQVIGE